ncbi:hypothetical protein GOP47_0012390 [Adiantum capillus-veneris]|uniref:Uncharacterized protein n=1 Tax=Adiantum capillus-veneris TaxID=13818 RepID=A0A9D4UR29_ADICA|nr:hypothetical protein GOP47_0012390 [Adiantum capillus-veneris]
MFGSIFHRSVLGAVALSNCRNLKWLSVASNELRSLNGIKALFNLQVLNCSCNKLASIREVEGLFGLKALIVNDNEISTLCNLQNLTALSTLVLSKNPISSFGAALEGVPSLSKLSLSQCKLQELGSIKNLVALKELRLAHNNLKYLSKDLAKNSRLQIIDVGSNCLKNISDVEVLSALPYLRNLNVRENPFCIQADYEEKLKALLPALRVLDGHPLREASKQRIKKLPNSEKAAKKKSVKADGVQEGHTSEDISHIIEKHQKKASKGNLVEVVGVQEGQTSEEEQEKLKKPKKRRKFDASIDEGISMREKEKASHSSASDKNDSEPFIELIGKPKPDTQRSKDRSHHGWKKEDSGLVSVMDNQSKVAKKRENKHIAKKSSAFSIYMGEAEVGGGGQSSWN